MTPLLSPAAVSSLSPSSTLSLTSTSTPTSTTTTCSRERRCESEGLAYRPQESAALALSVRHWRTPGGPLASLGWAGGLPAQSPGSAPALRAEQALTAFRNRGRRAGGRRRRGG